MALAIVAIIQATWLRAQIRNAAELDPQEAAQARQSAEDELEWTRAAVSEAHAAATAAKQELEAAVAAPRDDDGATANQPSRAAESIDNRAANSAVTKAATADVALLEKLIQNLKDERTELLTHMTDAHPLIVDADLRLVEYEQQLAALRTNPASRKALPPPGTVKVVDPRQTVQNPPSTPNPSETDVRRRREAAQRLERSLAKWEAAVQALETAIDAESSAAQRLAAVSAHAQANQSIDPLVPPKASDQHLTSDTAPPAASALPPVGTPSDRKGSQPLVLAALIIALVVAALASVKLARASDDTLFSGADDAAAALSLPVVGVIPALSPAYARGHYTHRFRALWVVGQMLVAVAIFAAVAYCVQNPAILWQLCTSPLETLREIGQ